MKVIIYQKKVTFNAIYYKEIEIECDGVGTKAKPFIIEPSERIPNSFYVKNSDYFIHIKNFTNFGLTLISCKNVTIKNCKMKHLGIVGCSNINIDNLLNLKSLNIETSKDIFIENSEIDKMKLYNSNSNFVKNCKINRIKEIRSSNNVFESIETFDAQSISLTKSKFLDFFNKYNLKTLIILIILYISIIIIFAVFFKLNIPMYIIIVFLFIGIFVFYLPEILGGIIKNRKKK
jgi:hypothetical protein